VRQLFALPVHFRRRRRRAKLNCRQKSIGNYFLYESWWRRFDLEHVLYFFVSGSGKERHHETLR
jgi:hypothetical protein